MDKLKENIQRAKNGYSKSDLWNFDEYLAGLINKATFELAENHSGYPNGLNDEKWTQILKDISFGFGSYLEMRSGVYDFDDKEFKRLKKEYKKGFELLAKYHECLWD